jgi:hypothetical protein
MRSLIRFLLLCLLPVAGWAQSSLPPCPSDTRAVWHNCFGVNAFPNGARYVGEFKQDKRNGQGVFTWAGPGRAGQRGGRTGELI